MLTEEWISLELLHPLVILSLTIAFAFSLLFNSLIFSLLFVKHKTLSIFLFATSFFLTSAIFYCALNYLYISFVKDVSGVGITGMPFIIAALCFGGFALSRRLFLQKRKNEAVL